MLSILSWFRHAPFTFWVVTLVAVAALVVVSFQIGSSGASSAKVEQWQPADRSLTVDREQAQVLRTSMTQVMAIVRDGGDPGPWAARTEVFARQVASERVSRVGASDAIVRAWQSVAASADRLVTTEVTDRRALISETRTMASFADALVMLTSPGGLRQPGADYLVPDVAVPPSPAASPAMLSGESSPQSEVERAHVPLVLQELKEEFR